MAYPDAEALLRTYLLPLVASLTTTIASRVPDPMPESWLQVRRVGGAQLRPVRDRPRIDVLAWAPTDPEAWTLAELARRSIHALQATALLGPVCYRVDEFLGPRKSDDPLTGTPRVWATYALAIRANDAIAR